MKESISMSEEMTKNGLIEVLVHLYRETTIRQNWVDFLNEIAI